MNNKKKKSTGPASDEVEEMLREAEDAVMLKLNINSHLAHVCTSDLHPDLDRRFQALKSGSAPSKKPYASKTISSETGKMEQYVVLKEDEEQDLFARFAALKASTPKPSFAGSSLPSVRYNQEHGSDQVNKLIADSNTFTECQYGNNDNEVQKVIMWAMDAARFDPSPSSDEEDCGDNHDEDSDSGVDDDDNHKKGKRGIHK
ncbi:hypothetical protein Ancab_016160 [Ancistrocladus abbreviatus]